jgi:hypothetical protein
LNLTFYVPAPETGGIPALSLAGPQYTGVVSWDSSGGAHNGIFQPGAVYTATVTMQAASGRTFSGVGQDAFRHWAASTGVSNNADSGVVSIVFPPTGPGEPVSSPIDLTAYIRRPVAGAERTTMFRTSSYYGTVEWEVDGAPMPDGFFRMDKVYTAKVTLFPVPGYVFPGGLTVTHTKADTAAMGATNPVQAEVSFTFDTTILRLAAGGDVSITWTGVPGYYYETHVFKTAGTYSLAFIDTATPSVIADYLIVAGGGGAGGDDNRPYADNPGGGGGGGVLYKTGQILLLSGGSVAITVGAGGAGGLSEKQGADGDYSSIGSVAVPGGGGGGGGSGISNMNNPYATGRPGGSGGGGGAKGYTTGAAGVGKSNTAGHTGAIDPALCGNNGGVAGGDYGGGGGGAGGPGGNGYSGPGAGGPPWIPPAEAAWIAALTGGVNEFSRGGTGCAGAALPPSTGFGDGGSSVPAQPGAAGHHGIVIIRFLNPGYTG